MILSNRTGELVILAGNQRYEAAKSNGLKEVPTALIDNPSEERERKIIIRDNVSDGEWNRDALANEWNQEELNEWGLYAEVFPEEEEEPESQFQPITFGIKCDTQEEFDSLCSKLNIDKKKVSYKEFILKAGL